MKSKKLENALFVVKKPALPRKEVLEPLSELMLSDECDYEIALVSHCDASSQEAFSPTLSCMYLDHVRLSACELKKLRVKDCCFSGCDLSNSQWVQSKMTRCEFSDCKLTGFAATEADFVDCHFSNCQGQLIQLQASSFKNVMFENCIFPEIDFRQCKFEKVRFDKCDLHNAVFYEAQLLEVDFRGSDLMGIKAHAKDLKGAIIGTQQAMDLAPQLARILGIQLVPER